MRKFLALFLLLFILASVPANAQTKTKKTNSTTTVSTSAKFGNTDGITVQQLRNYLEFIAADELEGRDTPSRGLRYCRDVYCRHLKSWGIKPAGDNGTYFQKFPLKRSKIDANGTRLEFDGQTFNYGEDFLSAYNAGDISGNIVYASHGWVIKSKNINAYHGIDVKDKIVVASAFLPKGIEFSDLKGNPGGDWFSPRHYAQANGAKAIILLGHFGDLASWQMSKYTQTNMGGLSFGNDLPNVTIPTITISPRLITAIFRGEKVNGSSIFNKMMTQDFAEAFDLKPTKKINLSVAVKTETVYSQNVVGILEGSDPVLKNEYVAVGAHYDHVGTNPFWNGEDKIWNGADDDGSGTVAVMAMAEAFSKGATRPKRSILFIWHAGEEHGLWGSEHFTNNPTVPISSIITQLNIDMIGRYQNPGDENHPQNKALPKPGEIFLIGSKLMSTELGEVSEATNKSFLNLNFNYKYDDPKDPEQFFYRSDHFNYARKGIPIIFYMDGSHADYHQVTDSIEKINFEAMEKVVRTIFATAWELGNRPTRPKVDKPLSAEVTGN